MKLIGKKSLTCLKFTILKSHLPEKQPRTLPKKNELTMVRYVCLTSASFQLQQNYMVESCLTKYSVQVMLKSAHFFLIFSETS